MTFLDRDSCLETEARIIAENEDYVAVSVRLPKAMIARNLLLLSALADLRTGTTVGEKPTPKIIRP